MKTIEEKKRDKAIRAVKFIGHNLKHLREFQDDYEIVMIAVSNDVLAHGNELAITFASERLRADKRIAMAAVKCTGYALEYLSEELRNDPEVVLAAIEQEHTSAQYMGEKLKEDKEFLTQVEKKVATKQPKSRR